MRQGGLTSLLGVSVHPGAQWRKLDWNLRGTARRRARQRARERLASTGSGARANRRRMRAIGDRPARGAGTATGRKDGGSSAGIGWHRLVRGK